MEVSSKQELKVNNIGRQIKNSWLILPSFLGNNMFCDFYNPVNRTYCKRLRVLCPEHCKDPKISEHDVCGCPLVTNVFSPTGEFCRAPKKSCTKHYVWEKLRRAEVNKHSLIHFSSRKAINFKFFNLFSGGFRESTSVAKNGRITGKRTSNQIQHGQ